MKNIALVLVLLFTCIACDRTERDDKKESSASERQTAESMNTEKHHYPSESHDAFIDACTETSGGNRAHCTCLFDEIRTAYDYEEFIAIELKMQLSETPEDFINFMARATVRCQE